MEYRLNCRPIDDLLWDLSAMTQPGKWHLDFGPLNIATIASAESALKHFLDTVDTTLINSVRLYQGPPSEDLPDYLDALVALLPDEVVATAHFDLNSIPSKADAARLISTERYPWIEVENRPNQDASLGLLFPLEALCTKENLAALDSVMASLHSPYRIVYEYNFTESWNGLDEVIVIDKLLSPMGERKICGFLAAGGKRISG
ncbi:MAG: hypothetical protein H7A39_05055 [Chlamydiales bacterium]|nr:hypothetical protein [Chlamydiales bacterium]